MPSDPVQPDSSRSTSPGSSVRHGADVLVSLLIAVIVFRAFQIEGYIISTGSMAPSLLGYHKRVKCPHCQLEFPFGVAFDESLATPAAAEFEETLYHEADFPDTLTITAGPEMAMCPNCRQHGIDVSRVPRTEGDQLLVKKMAYWSRDPRRWEVVVFRNPNRPTQAFVKRAIGLPGESIQIIDGDVFVNGSIARKSLAEQRSIRIPVYDTAYTPHDRRWQPRWRTDGEWEREGSGFRLEHVTRKTSWVTYRNYVRAGGRHATRIPLRRWPPGVQVPQINAFPFSFDMERRELIGSGVLSPTIVRELLQDDGADGEFRAAIQRLADESHIAPIDDAYGYNRYAGIIDHNMVADLMLETHITPGDATDLYLEWGPVGAGLICRFSFVERTVTLSASESGDILAAHPLPEWGRDEQKLVECSVFDRQLLVAVDGETIAPPIPIDDPRQDGELPRSEFTVRVGGRGVGLKLDRLRLFRDVYYTPGRAAHAVRAPYRLEADEFFVLGDNSPVSFDSRSWERAVVPRRHLLGKPFVVHLPSRPGRLRVGDYETRIRIPDFSRIRYIR